MGTKWVPDIWTRTTSYCLPHLCIMIKTAGGYNAFQGVETEINNHVLTACSLICVKCQKVVCPIILLIYIQYEKKKKYKIFFSSI